jgi:hypothetical protein
MTRPGVCDLAVADLLLHDGSHFYGHDHRVQQFDGLEPLVDKLQIQLPQRTTIANDNVSFFLPGLDNEL